MRIIKVAVFAILSVLLCACASQPINKILIPVACPAPVIPAKPLLPLASLTNSSTPADVIRAYILTTKILIIDNADLRARLASYSQTPP